MIKSFSIIDLLRNFGSVDFPDFLSKFSVLFLGVISTRVYYPPKKNRKLAKNLQKSDEPEVTQEV